LLRRDCDKGAGKPSQARLGEPSSLERDNPSPKGKVPRLG